MGQHTCHVPQCKAACPPRHLMCAAHWFKVPGHLQADVYATARARNPNVDASWGPWWRHQAMAIAHVMRKDTLPAPETPVTEAQHAQLDRIDKWEAKELAFADSLEVRDVKKPETTED